MNMISIQMRQEEWELLRDALADVACWHMGFSEARPDYRQPPQLTELMDLAGIIRTKLRLEVSSKSSAQ